MLVGDPFRSLRKPVVQAGLGDDEVAPVPHLWRDGTVSLFDPPETNRYLLIEAK